MSFEQAIAAIAGIIVLHERLTALQYLTIGAIIAASVGAVAGEQVPPDGRADFAP